MHIIYLLIWINIEWEIAPAKKHIRIGQMHWNSSHNHLHTQTERRREKGPQYCIIIIAKEKYGNLIKLLPFLSFGINDLCVLSYSVARTHSPHDSIHFFLFSAGKFLKAINNSRLKRNEVQMYESVDFPILCTSTEDTNARNERGRDVLNKLLNVALYTIQYYVCAFACALVSEYSHFSTTFTVVKNSIEKS